MIKTDTYSHHAIGQGLVWERWVLCCDQCKTEAPSSVSGREQHSSVLAMMAKKDGLTQHLEGHMLRTRGPACGPADSGKAGPALPRNAQQGPLW